MQYFMPQLSPMKWMTLSMMVMSLMKLMEIQMKANTSMEKMTSKSSMMTMKWKW